VNFKGESVLQDSESFGHWVPETGADRDAIREHLKGILATPSFSASKRYTAFLRHVIEASLKGRPEILKERTLGIEVFHRDPMYDTSSDPIVRTAACEVRKRLAQYYYESGHEQDIRIELPSGSYVPEFRHKNQEQSHADAALVSVDGGSPAAPLPSSSFRPLSRPFGYLGLVITLAIGVGVGAAGTKLRPWSGGTPIEEFWRPLINSPEAILVCMGELYAPQINLKPNGSRNRFDLPVVWTGPLQPAVSYSVASLGDSIALANVAAWLRAKGKPYVIQGDAATTFSVLGSRPAVLLGAFNNDWTIRLSDQWRYHFDMDPNSGQAWLADREKPFQKIGLHIHGRAVSETYEYGLVSRAYDAATGQTELVLAGVSGGGTAAAVEFVTNPTELEAFAKRASAGWQTRNMQIVVGFSRVDHSAGPLQIVATDVW
jgi:hypothetical protein